MPHVGMDVAAEVFAAKLALARRPLEMLPLKSLQLLLKTSLQVVNVFCFRCLEERRGREERNLVKERRGREDRNLVIFE